MIHWPSVALPSPSSRDDDAAADENSLAGPRTPRGNPVHRSASLQQPRRRPDRNNNGAGGGTLPYSSCSNFQLSHLLARAASYDAKWRRQLDEQSDGDSSVDLIAADDEAAGVDGWGRSVIAAAAGCRSHRGSVDGVRVQLPCRFRVKKPRLDAGVTDQVLEEEPSEVDGGQAEVAGAEQCPGKSVRLEANGDVVGDDNLEARERDIGVALQWIRQEIRALKVQDRSIMRQLFELGTTVRRLSGDLRETISCQTVAGQPLDVISDDADEDDDDATELPLPNLSSTGEMTPIGSQYRAVSIATVERRPSTKLKAFGQRLSGLWSRLHRSADSVDH